MICMYKLCIATLRPGVPPRGLSCHQFFIGFVQDLFGFCLGKVWEGEVLKAFLLRHRFDIVSITLGY